MYIKVYDKTDDYETMRDKCKKFMLDNQDSSFITNTLTLNICFVDEKLYGVCDEGEQCCSFEWDNIDDFLDDFLIHHTQCV